MNRLLTKRAILTLLCAALLTLPVLTAQARGRGPGEGHGRPNALVCDGRGGRNPDIPLAPLRGHPGSTEGRRRCRLGGELHGGVLATFEVQGEQFRVWVTNPATIQQILDLQAGTASAHIPSGVIHYGPGEGDHNAPWSWHLDPEQLELADFTIEVCDALPSYVEAHTAEFVEGVGRYCPWLATLVSVEDRR